MFAEKKIAVVVPAYNESKLIAAAVSSIPDFVDDIIVVDDASTDNTAGVLEELQANLGITCIRREKNGGVGAAIVTGYKAALHKSADVIVVMAGDAQMDPEDLPFLLMPVLRQEADYAKGDRLSWPGVSKAMPFMRFFGNHVLSILTRITSGYRSVRDSQCGYTAVSAEVLLKFNLDTLYPRYGFPNDMLAKLHTVSARVTDVPVRPIYGQEVSGISAYTAFVRVPMVLLRSFVYRIKNERLSSRRLSNSLNTEPINNLDV